MEEEQQYHDEWCKPEVLSTGRFNYTVFRNKNTNRQAVRKTPIGDFPGRRKAVKREVKFLKQLRNRENVVTMLDHGIDDDGRPYVMTSYARLGNLTDYFNSIEKSTIRTRAKFMFRQLCNVVDYLQAISVTHGKIEPSNILVTANHTLKICNFELAKKHRSTEFIRPEFPYGPSEPYMAPEVYQMDHLCPFQADMWSVGAVILMTLGKKYCWKKPDYSDAKYKKFFKKRGKVAGVRSLKNLDCDETEAIMHLLHIQPRRRWSPFELKKCKWLASN